MSGDSLHPNLKLLSYSSRLTLHTCPRKFQLNKLLWRQREESMHLDFGKVVGAGIQTLLLTGSKSAAYFEIFKQWPLELAAEDVKLEKQKKTFWYALVAVDRFAVLHQSVFAHYEVLVLDGKPATELGFCIDCGNGFTERGFVDIIMRHKLTNEIVVVELKTTGAYEVHEATYKNSGQALGYDIVLETALVRMGIPRPESYKVLYPVYLSSKMEWECLPFQKTQISRALWIRALLFDIRHITEYGEVDYFPQHGESCRSFNKDCQHFGLCEMSTSLLAMTVEVQEDPPEKYQFHFSLEQIVKDQLARMEATKCLP